MRQDEIWDAETAARYETDNAEMYAVEVLVPTVDLLVSLAAGGAALELAVGTGRVAVPLAARGVSVGGIEMSEAMAALVDAAIPVVIGDMATTRVPGSFSLVYLVFNTISNLLTQDEQVDCFHNAARHLAAGGCFVVELEVPQLRTLPPGRTADVFTDEPGYLGVDTYDLLHQRLTSHHVRFGEGREARISRSPHRFVWPAELDLMARLAGFSLESRSADWTGAPFTAESRSHVSVYRLPAD